MWEVAGMIVAKAIKPARFRSEVFRQEVERAAQEVARKIEADFKQTTKDWDRQPAFEKLVQVGPKSVEVLVGTDDEIYRYVDKGTGPHPIAPRGYGYPLKFQGTYTAKTIPGVLASRPGGASGPFVRAEWVMHPGTKPRNFDKLIQKKWEPLYRKTMEEAMAQATKKSGHAI